MLWTFILSIECFLEEAGWEFQELSEALSRDMIDIREHYRQQALDQILKDLIVSVA
jgi:hypothetical protein